MKIELPREMFLLHTLSLTRRETMRSYQVSLRPAPGAVPIIDNGFSTNRDGYSLHAARQVARAYMSRKDCTWYDGRIERLDGRLVEWVEPVR